MSDSISLQETNRLRLAAGLKPIPVPGESQTQDADMDAGEGEQREDPDVVAMRNYKERVEREERERREKETRERIAKAKNQLALHSKLKGSTLGASDPSTSSNPTDPSSSSTELSAKAWLKQSRKREKERLQIIAQAKRREEEEKERELAAIYGEEDIRGLKVAHSSKDLKDLNSTNPMILTLKDSKILDEGEDELQNVSLADEERRRGREVRKRKAREGYKGWDDEEFEEGEEGMGEGEIGGLGKRDVLSKYDEDYEGEGSRVEGFRLGGPSTSLPTNSTSASKRRKLNLGPGIIDDDDIMDGGGEGGEGEEGEGGPEGIGRRVRRELDNLNRYEKNFEASDYATEDMTIKKKKKKVKRSTRRADLNEDDEPTTGDIDMNASAPAPTQLNKTIQATDNFVDDDELQLALGEQRRKGLKKMKMRVGRGEEDLVARVTAARDNAGGAGEGEGGDGMVVGNGTAGGEEGGLTFDDTSEFVRNVSLENMIKREVREPRVYIKQEEGGEGGASTPGVRVKIEEEEPLGGIPIAPEADGNANANGAGNGDVEMEDTGDLSEEDEELAEMALRQGLSLEEMRLKMDRDLVDSQAVKAEADVEEPTSRPEPSLTGGVAGALALLRQQGAIRTLTPEQAETERLQKERDLWLADHRRRVAKRELERAKLRGGGMKDQAQREWETKTREQQEAREALSSYANYKPTVKIEYTDEFGRVQTPKEAWKSLSHKFHGKTSGRMKTELRLRRIEEERKREAMVAGDTPSGMLDAFTKRQEKTGEAYMTLSMGNRNYVPMDSGSSSRHAGPSGNKNAAASSSKAGSTKKNAQSGPRVLG